MSNHKPIKSYVRREGRMTAGQKQSFETLLPIYCIEYIESPVNFTTSFKRDAPMIMDIGFGMGATLLEQAKLHPQWNYLGVEVYRPGVGALLAAVNDEKLTNIRVMCHDAVEVLKHCVAETISEGVRI